MTPMRPGKYTPKQIAAGKAAKAAESSKYTPKQNKPFAREAPQSKGPARRFGRDKPGDTTGPARKPADTGVARARQPTQSDLDRREAMERSKTASSKLSVQEQNRQGGIERAKKGIVGQGNDMPNDTFYRGRAPAQRGGGAGSIDTSKIKSAASQLGPLGPLLSGAGGGQPWMKNGVYTDPKMAAAQAAADAAGRSYDPIPPWMRQQAQPSSQQRDAMRASAMAEDAARQAKMQAMTPQQRAADSARLASLMTPGGARSFVGAPPGFSPGPMRPELQAQAMAAQAAAARAAEAQAGIPFEQGVGGGRGIMAPTQMQMDAMNAAGSGGVGGGRGIPPPTQMQRNAMNAAGSGAGARPLPMPPATAPRPPPSWGGAAPALPQARPPAAAPAAGAWGGAPTQSGLAGAAGAPPPMAGGGLGAMGPRMFSKGGPVKSGKGRADGIAKRGKTRCKIK